MLMERRGIREAQASTANMGAPVVSIQSYGVELISSGNMIPLPPLHQRRERRVCEGAESGRLVYGVRLERGPVRTVFGGKDEESG